MATYEITAEMNLKKIIAETREVAQALKEFADNLELIEKKYAEPMESEVAESNNIYCTECPYFNNVINDGEQWFGARCDKDGHSTMPSMYAIKSLHNDCPLVAEIEPKEREVE